MGQEDLKELNSDYKVSVDIVRDKIGNKIFGISTHNLSEIKLANTFNLDYIGLGAYRATTTKKSVHASGNALLEIANVSKHKVALIGGVTLEDNFSICPQITYRVIGSNLMHNFLQNKH